MKKLKVIVCGSTFGQFYMEALLRNPDYFIFAGILGNGSERTLNCSKNYGVPLYHRTEELPDDIDLACVVVRSNVLGGKGTELAVQLLERGIHVIQEHPSHPKDLEMCFKIAQKNNLSYQVGNLYSNMKGIRKFIQCANYMNQADELVHIHLAFATQVSYPLIKILVSSLPGARNWNLSERAEVNSPFGVWAAYLQDIPISMDVHNEVVHTDPNNHMYLLHSITYIYQSGRLVLEDTFGPLLWIPRMNIPSECSERGSVKGEYPQAVKEKSHVLLFEEESTFEQILTEKWPQAIGEDLMAIYQEISSKKKDAKKIQQEILCAKKWSEITKDIGYPKESGAGQYKAVDIEKLLQICRE